MLLQSIVDGKFGFLHKEIRDAVIPAKDPRTSSSAENSRDCSPAPSYEVGKSKRSVSCSLTSGPNACSKNSEVERQCNHAAR